MKHHIKYIQISKNNIRVGMLEGQLIILVKNYTPLLDTPEVHADGDTHTYRVSVSDDICYEVNGSSQVNVGPKGDGGWKHEVACLPVQSMQPLPGSEATAAIAQA